MSRRVILISPEYALYAGKVCDKIMPDDIMYHESNRGNNPRG